MLSPRDDANAMAERFAAVNPPVPQSTPFDFANLPQTG
jgi:hypothetical protein